MNNLPEPGRADHFRSGRLGTLELPLGVGFLLPGQIVEKW
jgi:hypothetical protein